MFPNAIIYHNNEIIIEPKNNISFRLDNVENYHEFDCKMLEWCSRSSCKGVNIYWQRWMRRGLNSYFRVNWSHEEMTKIYTSLGNGADRPLCSHFIQSGFDMNVLNKELDK